MNFIVKVKLKKEGQIDEVLLSSVGFIKNESAENDIKEDGTVSMVRVYTKENKPDFLTIVKSMETEFGFRPKLSASGIKKIKDSLDEVFASKKKK